MKGRISFSLWSILLVGSAIAEDAPGVDYLATESKVFALLPPVPVYVPNHDLFRLGWTSQPNILWTTGVQRPKGPNRLIDYLKITVSENPRALFTYKLGDPAAKKLMDLPPNVEIKEVFTSRNSDWFLVQTDRYDLSLNAVNRQTGRVIFTPQKDFDHQLVNELGSNDPLFMISTSKKDKFDVRLSRFDFQSGEWIQVTFLKQDRMTFSFSDSVPEQQTIAFFYDDPAGGTGLVQIYDYAKNVFVKTVSDDEYFSLTEKVRFGRSVKWSIDSVQEELQGHSLPVVEVSRGDSVSEDAPRFRIFGAIYGSVSPDQKHLVYLSIEWSR